MTWDEIRAAYPPDTWVVLEVIEGEYDPPWLYYDLVRVLEVVPPDTDPFPYEQEHRALPPLRVLAFPTSKDQLRIKTVFMGFRRLAEPAPDIGGAPPVVVDLRAQRSQCDAMDGRRHGGGDHSSGS
jgi:hypothetical protein